jgi:lysophospholipase L1-like esterase
MWLDTRFAGRCRGRRRAAAAPAILPVLLFPMLVACDRGGSRDGGSAPSSAGPVRRVAAVGDSIAWGSGLAHRARDSYPAQLGRLLGDQHEVRNFWVNGTTLLRRGDRAYWMTSALGAAKAFAPDVVIIMLGTNDAKPQNWRYREEFVADYTALIDAFPALPSRPTIWVCRPVPTFGAYGTRDPVIRNEIIPLIDRVARVRPVSVIDLYSVLQGRADLFPNGIHPNAEGARLIAETVRRAIREASRHAAPRARWDAGGPAPA